MKNIVLIGMMGSGKTTVGKAISANANMPFIDTDSIIEESLKISIAQIFEQYGESYFRVQEAKAAEEAAKYSFTVIATGGGMVINPQNMLLFEKNSFIVYLKCHLNLLCARTSGDDNRPINHKLKELLLEREHLYEKYSHLILDGGLAVNELAERILYEYSCH